MPSATTPAMSAAVVITTLWPIAATGSLPTWRIVMVNSLHDAGTVISFTLYWIASLLSISTAQLAAAASLLSAAGAGLAVSAAAAPVSAGTVAGVSVAAGSM